MDYRAALVFLVSVSSLLAVTGCGSQGTLPLVKTGDLSTIPADAVVQKEKEVPRHAPKPETCVKCGDFKAGAALDPNLPPLSRDQLREEARLLYQQAMSTDPNYLPAYISLAKLYVAMDQPERAVATYNKARKIYPQNAELLHDLGMCYARKQDFEPAVAYLRKAMELDPERQLYGNSLGFCLARAGRYDESLAVFRKIVGEAQAHYQLAQMLHHQKQESLSRQHLQLALQANPNLKEAATMLAELDRNSAAPAGRPISAVIDTVRQ